MLEYHCEYIVTRHNLTSEFPFSFARLNLEGVYPSGFGGSLRLIYGIHKDGDLTPITTSSIAPSVFVTGVKIEEVALNASLCV